MTFQEIFSRALETENSSEIKQTKPQTDHNIFKYKTAFFSEDKEWKMLSDLFKINVELIENKGVRDSFNYKKTYQKFHKVEAVKERVLNEDQRKAFSWLNGLGSPLNTNFTHVQLKSKFREYAKVFHPDYGGNAEAFIKLEQCYKILRKVFF